MSLWKLLQENMFGLLKKWKGPFLLRDCLHWQKTKSIMKDFEPEINHWLNTIMPKWHRLNRDLYTKLSFISNLIFKITYLIFISICFIFHDGIIINLFNTIYFGLFDVVAEYKRSCNWYTSNCPITLDQRESF